MRPREVRRGRGFVGRHTGYRCEHVARAVHGCTENLWPWDAGDVDKAPGGIDHLGPRGSNRRVLHNTAGKCLTLVEHWLVCGTVVTCESLFGDPRSDAQLSSTPL